MLVFPDGKTSLESEQGSGPRSHSSVLLSFSESDHMGLVPFKQKHDLLWNRNRDNEKINEEKEVDKFNFTNSDSRKLFIMNISRIEHVIFPSHILGISWNWPPVSMTSPW